MQRVIFPVAAAIALTASAAAQTPAPDGVVQAVVEGANAFRADNGLRRLSVNAKLTSEAQAFAAYLASTDRFSHTADGRDPGARAQAAGYDYCDLAENIALEEGYPTERLARLFMAGWEASPGHRRNLLDGKVTETGVGVARAPGPIRRYFAVQVFGRPASARYSFRIENHSDVTVGYEFEGQHRMAPARSIMTHTTCADSDLIFDRNTVSGYLHYAVTPGAAYVLSPAPTGVQIEVRRSAGPSDWPDPD